MPEIGQQGSMVARASPSCHVSAASTSGLHLYGSGVSAESGDGARYDAGEMATASASASSLTSYSLNIRYEGALPLFIGTGDSIMEGHNQPPQWVYFSISGKP